MCQRVWIQIRPDILSGLIWIQTVCKDYQQTTLAGKEVNLVLLTELILYRYPHSIFNHFYPMISFTLMELETMWILICFSEHCLLKKNISIHRCTTNQSRNRFTCIFIVHHQSNKGPVHLYIHRCTTSQTKDRFTCIFIGTSPISQGTVYLYIHRCTPVNQETGSPVYS